MSQKLKPYRIKAPPSAKRASTKENAKSINDSDSITVPFSSEPNIAQITEVQTADLSATGPAFGSADVNSVMRKRPKSTRNIPTQYHSKTERIETTEEYCDAAQMTSAILTQSDRIAMWLGSGCICLNILETTVRDCIYANRLYRKQESSILPTLMSLVQGRMDTFIKMKNISQQYAQRENKIASMIQERLKKLQNCL